MITFKIKNKMMNRKQIGFFAYVLLVAVIFCSCEQSEGKDRTQERIIEDDFYTYTYDSCEYVGTKMYWNSAVLVHKGNCKFCAERSKK